MDSKSAKNRRGEEEIRKELESLKGEIKEAKTESEKEAKDFLTDLNDTIDEKVSEIESQKNVLESEIKGHYDRALEAGKQFYDTLEKYNKKVVNTFRFVLFAFFLSVISVILLIYAITNLIRDYAIILGGLVAFIFLIFYWRVSEFTKISLEKIKDTIKIFGTSPSIRDIKATNITREKKSKLDKLGNTLGGFLALIGKTVLGLDKWFNEYTLLVKYRRKVKEFESTLDYYNLKTSNPDLLSDIGKSAPAKAEIVDDPSYWEDIIVEKIIEDLPRDLYEISNETIYILYKEHYGEDTRSIFRKIKEDEKALKSLASILFSSGRLTRPPGTLSYDVEDVCVLIKNVEHFDFSQINNLLSKALRQLDYVQSYKDFLEKNGIKTNSKPTIKFVLEKVDNSTNSFEEQVIDLAYKFGLDCYGHILQSKELVDGFARASVSIKFNSEISLRSSACKISSNYLAVAVIRAYYEKTKQRGTEFVTLEDLIKDTNMINLFIKNRDDIEFRFLESQLKEGKWYDSPSAYLKAFLDEMKVELKTQIEKVQKYIILKEAVRKTFEQVKIGTVDKAIDAQVFSAYLIMSSSSVGRLAPIIDALSLRDLEKPKERRWEWKDQHVIQEIKNQYGVRPRHDFMKFSDSTWVGVLEKGESFTGFKNNFLADLNKMFQKTGEEFNIGLVLQRISPSKYSFGILEDAPENVSTKDLEIAQYVARLASDHVPEEEQVSIMTFDKDVDLLRILDTKSVFELIRVENDDIIDKERKILEGPSLREDVLRALEIKFDAKSFKSLALDLAKNVIDGNEVATVVEGVFEKFDLRRASMFSKRLVNVLQELAVLYEIQRR